MGVGYYRNSGRCARQGWDIILTVVDTRKKLRVLS